LAERTADLTDSSVPTRFELRTLGMLALLAGLLVNPGSLGVLFATDGVVESARFLALILGGQIVLVALGVWLLLRDVGRLGSRPLRRLAALGLLAAAAGGGFGVWRWVVESAPDDPRPNIVLVVLDTTRRDRLSLYGYERPTTPQLEQLATESTVWEEAYSTSSWTSPSHASLFTGLHPAAHGVTQSAWSMGPELDTLAERLSAGGYRTAGIVGNPMVGRVFGFDQGFDEYHETWREKRAPGREHPAVEHLGRLLDSADRRPLFAFINLIEPHSPYTSGAEHREDFVRHADLELVNNQWRSYYAGEVRFDPRELEQLGDVYDAGLRHVDELVGALVASLRAHGVLERTVLVVTSDHGENLGEHEHLDHVFSLYEPTVRIPLLARHPGSFAAGARVEGPVQLTDVYFTLLGIAGLEPGGTGGVTGGRDLRGSEPLEPRPVLLSYDYPKQALRAMGERAEAPALELYKRRLWALREGDLKLIAGDDGQLELYDLSADPGELHDLAPQQVERAEALRARLLELVASHRLARAAVVTPRAEGGELDPVTAAKLRELGYLGAEQEEGELE